MLTSKLKKEITKLSEQSVGGKEKKNSKKTDFPRKMRRRNPHVSDVVWMLSINQRELWQIFVDDTASTWYSLLSIQLWIEWTHNKNQSEKLNVNKVIRLIKNIFKTCREDKKKVFFFAKDREFMFDQDLEKSRVFGCVLSRTKYFNGDFGRLRHKNIKFSSYTFFFYREETGSGNNFCILSAKHLCVMKISRNLIFFPFLFFFIHAFFFHWNTIITYAWTLIIR